MTQRYSDSEIQALLHRIARLKRQGRSVNAICRTLQIGKGTYYRWLERYGLPAPPKKRPRRPRSPGLKVQLARAREEQAALSAERDELRRRVEDLESRLHELATAGEPEPLAAAAEAVVIEPETVDPGPAIENDVTTPAAEDPAAEDPPAEDPTPDTPPGDHPAPDLEEKHRQGRERFRERLETGLAASRRPGSPSPARPWVARFFGGVGQWFKPRFLPLGIDLEDDGLTFVQLQREAQDLRLVHAVKIAGPPDLDADSPAWMNWAAQTLRNVAAAPEFRSRRVALALPVRDTFIDHLRLPTASRTERDRILFDRMRLKLPFRATPQNTLIRAVPSEQGRVVAIALERTRVERYMDMCLRANLDPELLSVWPVAMVNSYRLLVPEPDDTVVMLLDVSLNYTNVVICRHSTLCYARSIPLGVRDLSIESLFALLAEQIRACRKHFMSLYGQVPIERTIYFASRAAERQTIQRIARQTGVNSQLGNPLEVLQVGPRASRALGGRPAQPGWSVALGLSLDTSSKATTTPVGAS